MPRGGARAGAGRKKKPLFNKLLEGNPGKRPLTTVQFDNLPAVKQTTELAPPSFLALATKQAD
ncbi:hypothetical protein AGMMS49992_30820 [Clostridia bacterium]|nr:hypothetical protein AGMMS49992_30820 [Clostridia bacterium]